MGIAFGSYVNESQFNQLLRETILLIGEVYVSPAWFNTKEAQAQHAHAEASAAPKVKPENLPERARRVLALMAEGKTNWQIASILRYSESTVKGDASMIYRAFGVNTREAAVEKAQQAGLL